MGEWGEGDSCDSVIRTKKMMLRGRCDSISRTILISYDCVFVVTLEANSAFASLKV